MNAFVTAPWRGAAAAALFGRSAPMTALDVTDARKWSVGSWASELIPHVAYGPVTEAVLGRLDR